MPKKNCLNCIAYCNMLADGKCGLGFEVEEVTETSAGFSIAVQPVDECTVAMPRTRKDFVKKAMRGKVILQPHGKEFFTWYSKHFFT